MRNPVAKYMRQKGRVVETNKRAKQSRNWARKSKRLGGKHHV